MRWLAAWIGACLGLARATPCMQALGRDVLVDCFEPCSEVCTRALAFPVDVPSCPSARWREVWFANVAQVHVQRRAACPAAPVVYLWSGLGAALPACAALEADGRMTSSCFAQLKQKCSTRRSGTDACGLFYSPLHQACFSAGGAVAGTFAECVFAPDAAALAFVDEVVRNATARGSGSRRIDVDGLAWLDAFGCSARANRNPPFPCPCTVVRSGKETERWIEPCQAAVRRDLLAALQVPPAENDAYKYVSLGLLAAGLVMEYLIGEAREKLI